MQYKQFTLVHQLEVRGLHHRMISAHSPRILGGKSSQYGCQWQTCCADRPVKDWE